MTASQFAQLVRGRKTGRDKYVGYCPSHPDRNRSLSIAEGRKGIVLRCMSRGCDTRAVLDALGLKWADLFTTATPKRDAAHLSDAAKLDALMRRHTLALWMAAVEPGKRRYWHAAARGIADEMEPLYWRVMPDRERIDEMRRWESEDYQKRRMDWIEERASGRCSQSSRKHSRTHSNSTAVTPLLKIIFTSEWWASGKGSA